MREIPFELDVFLQDHLVGKLLRSAYETHTFLFDPSYSENAKRPTLSLGFKAATGHLLTSIRPQGFLVLSEA